MNNRLQIIAQLLEATKLHKLAQETDIEGEMDKETADKMAEQIFDQLWDEMVDQTLGNLPNTPPEE